MWRLWRLWRLWRVEMRFCGNDDDDDNKRGGSGILTLLTLHPPYDCLRFLYPSIVPYASILSFHRSFFGEWTIINSLGYCCGLFV